MRFFALFLLCCVALAQADAPQVSRSAAALPVEKPVVVARYPHDQNAFVQGLEYLGKDLYLRSTGLVGSSGVQVVHLKTGQTLRSVPMPIADAFGEGSTALGGTVYYLTWQHGQALSFDLSTLKPQGQFPYKGEGWGLTNDGRRLIMSNGSAELTWRQPRTFGVLRRVTVRAAEQPVTQLNELEHVRGTILANIWLTDRIARIDAATGKVLGWIDVSELSKEASQLARSKGQPLTFDDVANGIAYVPERGTLLLTGKRWPILFEVKVSSLGR